MLSPEEDDDNYKDTDQFIYLENVHKTYLLGVEGIAALRFPPLSSWNYQTIIFSGVEMEVHKGEFLMICGTSGGGFVAPLELVILFSSLNSFL